MNISTSQLFHARPLRVADIGASGGVDPRWERLTNDLRLILVEPDPREAERLRKNLTNNYLIIDRALSDKPGPIKLHLCENQQLTSVYLPNENVLKNFP